MLTIDNWMVAWNPVGGSWSSKDKPGAVMVGPWPDRLGGWSREYDFTTGCCELARHKMTLDEKAGQMFIDFHTMVVRDGIKPETAHEQLLKIDEYRRRIAPDIPGWKL